MARKITNTTFNINIPSINLEDGDDVIFKFRMESNNVPSSNFTASIAQGSLKISSLAASTGYTTTNIPFFNSAAIALNSNTDEIILSSGVSGFYGGDYIFVPNPLKGTESTLYAGDVGYGDVDYPFTINPYDIALIYLSDGTYIETRILQAYKQSGLMRLKLDISLSTTLKSELVNQTYKRFLILSRRVDETNVILSFTKRDGKTSYGFLIPENLSTEVLSNIDTITREVKQKLINDQNVISDINGGTFGP
jgi:cold shock CspA family protein